MFKRTTISALVIGASLSTFPAFAAENVTGPETVLTASYHYDIPAGALSDGLLRFAATSGLSLSAQASLTLGKQNQALSGELTVEQALEALLRGTGLKAMVQDSMVLLSGTSQYTFAEQPMTMETLAVTAKRADRVSKGATGLELDLKDTPQSISSIEQQSLAENGLTKSNEALNMITGLNVEQYETNRATFNSRGFEVQLTQTDGLGVSNSFGTVTGQQDTFLFEKIEVIRGANGLLTGVGNASGTINYVRKRPTNEDEGQVSVSAGSYDTQRAALDYNKVLTEDGSWAARVVMATETGESYIRDLENENSTVYAVVDGQVGDNGILTFGMSYQDANQDSPMWGSLTLNVEGGSQASFARSSSTAADWAYWDTETTDAFVEYTHLLSDNWEAKATYNHREFVGDSQLLYAYSTSGSLNTDYSNLVGWPYKGHTEIENDLFDINLSGDFEAFGRQHQLLAGISYSEQNTKTYSGSVDDSEMRQSLPSFPYDGSAYPEPSFGDLALDGTGEQQLTRVYLASKLQLADQLHSIIGMNAIKLERAGKSIYGNAVSATNYPDTEEVSPYVSFLYDFTDDVLGYVSYSDIYQNQDQTDINGNYLDPVKGVNYEAGIKAEWFDKRVLTSFAVFEAKQTGLATYAGINSNQQYYYEPKDVTSRGYEVEASGYLTPLTRLSLGLTHLKLTGPDGKDIYQWVPRNSVKLMLDARLASMPELKLGVNTRWQSDVQSTSNVKQDAYMVTNAFVSYELTDDATLRLNVNNIFDEKYIQGLAYGAIYGAPRSATATFDYRF